ncbi:hypothetical protein PoB_000816600 [Plakobranchus ocellatus]|uniref:Uncharacterized protein n=1 Tax=Plakobranchus ocellatus TaxID=259542 RepID=A0AAV3YEP8_9GAST|nr:hypothetical protein PoB_000816600 [Plakobranchus ocellatus]
MTNQKGQAHLQHFLRSIWRSAALFLHKKGSKFQNKSEFWPSLRIKDKAGNQNQYLQTTGVCGEMSQKHPENKMARNPPKRTTVGNDKAISHRN